MKTRAALILLLLWAAGGAAAETITRGGNLAVDVADDGRMAVDLVGELWTVPLGGGVAQDLNAPTSADSISVAQWGQ